MNIQRNIEVVGKHTLPVPIDIYFEETGHPKPLVIFAHGFKGFKDWGHWDLIAKAFAQADFVFIKFNFSHNGTSLEQPIDFANLEAFGQNNYSKELADLDTVLTWLTEQSILPQKELNLDEISLIGHSRGGGIAIIKTIEDSRIKSLITWAAVSNLAYAWINEEKVRKWKDDGVYYQLNGRTKQQMPLYYQLYEDYKQQRNRLDIQTQIKQLSRPFLIVHGTNDPAVPFFAAHQLQEWSPTGQLVLINGADHVFGGSHPYTATELPEHSQKLVEESIAFLKSHLN